MITLVLSSLRLPAERSLADAAAALGWQVHTLDSAPAAEAEGEVVVHVETGDALRAACELGLALLEPPLDLLARLPLEFRRRQVEPARWQDLARLRVPTFVKPADPLAKVFDAGIYSRQEEIRAARPVDPRAPVLVAEPVAWLAEYRCFVCEREVIATSPHLSFGRPVWRPFGAGGERDTPSASALAFCAKLFRQTTAALPPAFVVDVGVIEDRGWAVVEFNPIWCAGLLAADPGRVLPGLRRACRRAGDLDPADEPWVIRRGGEG